MKEKVLSAALALSIMAGSVGTAFAENPKAEEYRKLFASGTYYIDYDMNDSVRKALAVSDGKRMDYTIITRRNAALSTALAFIPVIGIAGMFVKETKKDPTALYQDNKYYQFIGKKEARVATSAELKDENLDPTEAWNSVPLRLALPEGFVMLAPNDPFNKIANYTVPAFVESGTITDGKNTFDYDTYKVPVQGATGNVLADKIFYLYYDNKKGELKRVITRFKEPGSSMEQTISEFKIRTITGELPENALKMPGGTKVYAAGLGDMDDLLDRNVLVEQIPEDSDDAGSGKESKDAK